MSESSLPRVWVVGAIAWDTVLHVAEFPVPGSFTPKIRRLERPGGSAANVAQAVATSGLESGFVTVLGRDDIGTSLHRTLQESELDHLHIRWVDEESIHVLVLVDGDGDRSIIALAGDGTDSIHLDDVPLRQGDIVVFVVWDESFRADLQRATDLGCVTVVGLAAINDPTVTRADIAFGSHVDIPKTTDPGQHLDRFDRIVMTSGEEGGKQYTQQGVIHQPAFAAAVIDTTGAGDAFLAGYLSVYARGLRDGRLALEAGARWAAAMVGIEASIPPPWESVEGLPKVDVTATAVN